MSDCWEKLKGGTIAQFSYVMGLESTDGLKMEPVKKYYSLGMDFTIGKGEFRAKWSMGSMSKTRRVCRE